MENTWCLKHLSLFQELEPINSSGIALNSTLKKFSKKEIILEPENKEKVYLIKKGQVKLYQLTIDGKKVVLDTLGPGCVFGNLGAIDEGHNFAEALSDVEITVSSKENFFESIASKPEVATRIMRMLFEQITHARDYISAMTTGGVLSKLKYKLNELGLNYGEDRGEKVKITTRFTHEEIANMIGVSRETVTKLLGSLKKQGIVEMDGKYIIYHKEKLETAQM